MARRWWAVLAWVAWLAGVGVAQTALEHRLNRLPMSVGDNYTITRRAGESWVDIGIREHVGYQHLRWANGSNFNAATTLFIPGRHQVSALVQDGLVINLPELMDFHWLNGKPVAWYPVSIGQVAGRWNTPVGELQVINREKNPVWHRPSWAGGGQVPPGPRNPLGDRWIGLSRPGYGLHGTNDPTSIGRLVSHGCIRHFPPHIRAIFEYTRIGTPVIITYETVTVGQEQGIIYMAVFPDIYGRNTNAPARVRTRLAAFGLENALTERELAQRLALADGVSRRLLGSATRVTVNGAAIDTTVGPTVKNGTTYLPVRLLAEAIDAQLAWDRTANTLTISRNGLHTTFPTTNTTFLALDTLFAPVRTVIEGLGGSVEYKKTELAIRI